MLRRVECGATVTNYRELLLLAAKLLRHYRAGLWNDAERPNPAELFVE
jgi:hypothetical protein